ncbi:MAG: aldose 1-epimerase [Gemmataceae bacterium]
MSYHIHSERRLSPSGRSADTLVLRDDEGAGLEIWPAEGFNAFSWFVEHGGRQDLFYASPALFDEKRPTRSGNPILFPFPNRIRDASFSWAGQEYRLPATDGNGRNAIHGFAVRLPWRVVAQGADATGAFVTGEFQASKDSPDIRANWPADYRVRLTYRLGVDRLRVETVVDNPDHRPLPFGLGFHPYFSLASFGKEEAIVGVPANRYWPLEENLPTGTTAPVAGMRDLRAGREVGSLKLDDVLTGLDHSAPNAAGLLRFGWIDDWQQRRRLTLWASAAFREVVVFNPPHRQAFCIEPYTCVTDAVHLQERGIDAGWQVLDPGGRWESTLEYVFERRG